MTLAVPILSNPLSRITSRLLYLTRSSTRKSLKDANPDLISLGQQLSGASVEFT